ncbi:MAG TPA: heparan-alpha-glucosaminide N-acetyltransferase domain-containing protein [Puia sp.]|nr:heparan-alpha-glucosaminide N-acetyltransferase domain-containing protein [Puia sp.]
MNRIKSIDFARGLVMIIMALDHTRDLLHVDSLTQDPTNLATTSPVLFFTRWITHFCAPSFVFLSGVSAYLSFKNRGDIRESRRFLLKRGLWLIILEFTVVNFFLWCDIHFRTLIFEVIAAIGCGFIILSLLYRVSPKIAGIAGLVIIFGHDLLPAALLPANPVLRFFASLLVGMGAFRLTPHLLLVIAYPVLPWLGIMLAGFGCGRLFELPAGSRKKVFGRIGGAALVLFILLRAINVYGNPEPWSVQKNAVFTFLSFINYSKYPPSLCFALVTLGGLLLLLAFAEGWKNKFTETVSVYGKTPLFYFLIHLGVIHSIMFIMVFAQGYHPADLVFGPLKCGRPAAGSGITLPFVYMVWLGVVALMYPLCSWYGRYKTSHPGKKWLRYL